MVPLSEIISRTRTRFEQESSVRWSDSDIADSINEGLDELSEATEFYERYVVIPLRAGRTYYDIRGFLPENALGVTAVWCTTTSRWLYPTRAETLKYPQWERTTGPPESFFLRGVFRLGIHPKVNADSGFLRVHFFGLAPHLDHPQAVLADLPDDYIPALEDYVLYDLQSNDGEVEKGLIHWASYREREKSLGSFVEKRIVRPRTFRLGGG